MEVRVVPHATPRIRRQNARTLQYIRRLMSNPFFAAVVRENGYLRRWQRYATEQLDLRREQYDAANEYIATQGLIIAELEGSTVRLSDMLQHLHKQLEDLKYMVEEQEEQTQELKRIRDQTIRDDELYKDAIDSLEKEVDHQTQLKEQALIRVEELERQLVEQCELPLGGSGPSDHSE